MEIGYRDMTSPSGLAESFITADYGVEFGSSDPPVDWIPGAAIRWVLTPLVAFWCAFLVLTWLPSYLTWPWQNDTEHFAMLAQLWDSGKLPYRDMFSTQFPGEIYILYLLGKAFGWGNTVAYYAFDAALVIAFLILLVVWGHRRTGRYLPGLIGGSTFLLYYVSQNTLVAGEREWHAGFLMMFSLLLLGLGSGRPMRLCSAVAFRSGDRCAAAGLCALASPLAGDRWFGAGSRRKLEAVRPGSLYPGLSWRRRSRQWGFFPWCGPESLATSGTACGSCSSLPTTHQALCRSCPECRRRSIPPSCSL